MWDKYDYEAFASTLDFNLCLLCYRVLDRSKMTTPHSWNHIAMPGGDLPDWAQFMLDLGRHSGLEYSQFPGHKVWKLVTAPHRGMASAMFALGFMEATVGLVVNDVLNTDLTKLKQGDRITWRHKNNQVECGIFEKYSNDAKTDEPILHYQPLREARRGNKGFVGNSKSNPYTSSRRLRDAKAWQLSPYDGEDFSLPRPMSNNIEFFKSFYPTSHFELLCNTDYSICMVGRPALWEDLCSHEISISGVSGCVDDLLRVGGDSENPAGDVSHYLTKFFSPDRDVLEPFNARCCVYDGSNSYPKLKNFIHAQQNLILLDRWETGSVSSVNAFVADYQYAGVNILNSPKSLNVPPSLEYAEWRDA